MADVWDEYDRAAMDMAKRGLKGQIGDPLPNLMSAECVDLINEDVEAFQLRIRQSAYAYAIGMGLISVDETTVTT
jgi:hypothetical protein